MNRFFTPAELIGEETAKIVGNDVAHISKVLRLSIGDTIELCDGQCNDYIAEISKINKDCVSLKLLQHFPSPTESKYQVTLFQCLPKAAKLETIIQKSVELGVFAICPVESERCVIKLDKRDSESKRIRMSRVAYEAAKQSKRGILPEILPVTRLNKLDLSNYDIVILAYESESGKTLKDVLKAVTHPKNIAIIVGPEGGFAPDGVSWLTANGSYSVSLGTRILRTETAGMAMLAMINYELEL